MTGIEPGAALPSVILSLAAVLGVLALALFVGRWMQRRGRLPRSALLSRGEGQGIRLLSARALGWQNSLHLLEVDGQRFLVGVSRSGVIALGNWQSPAAEARSASPERLPEAASGPVTRP
jgi:flagellar biogenesis protein FliO